MKYDRLLAVNRNGENWSSNRLTHTPYIEATVLLLAGTLDSSLRSE